MSARSIAIGALVVAMVASTLGCASRSTDEASRTATREAAAAAVPAMWGGQPAGGAASSAEPVPWERFVADEPLRRLVQEALANNRDLRVAALNVERAQAQLRATGANRWPQVGVGGTAQRAPNTQGGQSNTFTAGLQLTSWEIDFFGRLASLDDAARAQWLATDAGRRATELSIVAGVVNTVLALRADTQLRAIAQRTAQSRDASLDLVKLRERQGASSLVEVESQALLASQARAAVAQYTRLIAQDETALQLLLGRALTSDERSGAARGLTTDATDATFTDVPAGLASTVLLDRPDVIAAEQQLASAQANVDAARKAVLPAITLTAQAGQASSELRELFRSGNFAYTIAANLFFSIFDGGRRQAGIDAAESTQRIALAQYERAVQAAFKETVDAMSAVQTWREQRVALDEQQRAASELSRLVDLRAQRGASSLLEQLDAQRNLFAAEQAVVQARQAEQASRVALWRALGR